MRWAGVIVVTACGYAAIVGLQATDQLIGDEGNYLSLASNLTHGYFSPPDQVHLWWGPGYPLLLAPFVALHMPLLGLRLLNAVLATLSVGLIYASVPRFVSPKWGVLITLFAGIYLAIVQPLALLLTEPLALFLASLAMYLSIRFRGPGASIAVALALGYLALTKVVFGWVLLGVCVASILILLATREAAYRQWIVWSGLALLLCTPYLAYTLALTGHWFYWGSSGGLSLYWMSTPYPGEVGDWFPLAAMRDDPRLALNHARDYALLDGLDEVHQDDVLRGLAIANIEQHPVKYTQNWLANMGRLFVNYPYSYTPFRPTSLGIGALNAPFVIGALLAIANRRKVVFAQPIGFMLMLGAVALGASSLLSAYPRQLVPLAPWLVVGLPALLRRP